MGKQNIVIVGGGSAGVNAAKTLSRSLDASKYQLILINPLPYRIWLIATLRLTVSPQEGLKEEIMLPYDKIFAKGNGKFVEGTVASFEASKEGGGIVTLESGEKIEYVALRFLFIFGLRAHARVKFLDTMSCFWRRVRRGVVLPASLVPTMACKNMSTLSGRNLAKHKTLLSSGEVPLVMVCCQFLLAFSNT